MISFLQLGYHTSSKAYSGAIENIRIIQKIEKFETFWVRVFEIPFFVFYSNHHLMLIVVIQGILISVAVIMVITLGLRK